MSTQLPDFSPVNNGEVKLIEWAQREGITTADDLRRLTLAVLSEIDTILGDADDDAITFTPDDPNADDPHAPEHERYLGWTLAHIILHTTASAEEWAAVASLLARGIPYTREPRLRYEPDWHSFTTRAQVDQRLAESRRIRLAYLDAFPDTPHFDVKRDLSERFIEKNGEINAIAAYLYGLKHEMSHLDQLRDAARQAHAAAVR